MSESTRKFLAVPRCIYTREQLDPNSKDMRSTNEHIIPLSLGGVDALSIDGVSALANSKAGNLIDDEAAKSFPFLLARHRYNLSGRRGDIPDVKFTGKFSGIDKIANLSIDAEGALDFEFSEPQKQSGRVIHIEGTEERVRYLLAARLTQAKSHSARLVTLFGDITDNEDIDVALLLADRTEGTEFKSSVSIDLNAFQIAHARLALKIAIGLGHRVFGAEWTFGPGAQSLQKALFPKTRGASDPKPPVKMMNAFPEALHNLFEPNQDSHLLVVLPAKKRSLAAISLFGGRYGVALVDLNFDSRSLVSQANNKEKPFEVRFEIPLTGSDKGKLKIKLLHELANYADKQFLFTNNDLANRSERRKKNA